MEIDRNRDRHRNGNRRTIRQKRTNTAALVATATGGQSPLHFGYHCAYVWTWDLPIVDECPLSACEQHGGKPRADEGLSHGDIVLVRYEKKNNRARFHYALVDGSGNDQRQRTIRCSARCIATDSGTYGSAETGAGN